MTYKGNRVDSCTGITVQKDGMTFDPKPSQTVWNHSPDGFNWGYGGSGAAQLALAMLLDATDDKDLAARFHQRFKADVVAHFDNQWEENTNVLTVKV